MILLGAVAQRSNAQLTWSDQDNFHIFGQNANVGIIDVGFNIVNLKEQHTVEQDRIETGRPYINRMLKSRKGFPWLIMFLEDGVLQQVGA